MRSRAVRPGPWLSRQLSLAVSRDSSLDLKSIHHKGVPEILERQRKMQPQTLDTCINFASAASGKAFELIFPRPRCFRGGISQHLKL